MYKQIPFYFANNSEKLHLFQNDAVKITIRTSWVAYISYIYSM